MGVWGWGLYSGDFAADLRAAIRAVVRLPFEADKLADIVSSLEPAAAHDTDNEEHTTFWLVVADQFAKRGIACKKVRAKALEIIDEGSDLAVLARLGMKPALLRKRKQLLTELRAQLESPRESKPRAVLKEPQPFLMQNGDVLVYPTSRGKCINSYYPSKDRIPTWRQDGWGAALIVEVGRAFEFLAWYRPAVLFTAVREKPDLGQLQALSPWVLRRPGTCSAVHFKRIELEKIGVFPVDSVRLNLSFPQMKPGTYQAINDISIANELSVNPPNSEAVPVQQPKGLRADSPLLKLADIFSL